nr:hypothetical protein [Tanacetum cinerariifolium]
GSITEFVYLVKAHHHLNPIFIPKDNSPRRLDDGVVMLVLEARGHPLRFGEVHLSLVALNPKLEVFYALSDNQLSGPLVDSRGPPSGSGLLTLCLSIGSSTLLVRSLWHSSIWTGTLDERIDQAGSGVVGHSSSKGFHQPCLKFTVGIWALSMSSSSDNCAGSSGPIASSMSRSARVKDISGLSVTSGVVQT